ncbi:MAG: uroporphyrinogen decarboxylase family protein [Candidatus Hodarchaeales archaeon]
MFQQDKFSILKAVVKQEKTTRVPYALWKHFPEADKNPEDLAKAQIKFQKEFDSVFMKIAPHGSYCVVDFGGILGDYRPVSGSRICIRAPIMSLGDWETLEPVDINDGEYGAQIRTVELIHKEIENEVPAIMTIFSPFMVASKLDPSLLEHIFQDRELLAEQIGMLTKLTSEFANATLDAGADGIFLATQHFNEQLPYKELQEFEFNPMKNILEKIPLKKAVFNILHLHGDKPFFRSATELPNIQAINWHDQKTKPTLLEGRADFNKALVGGLDEMEVLRKNDPELVEKSIKQVYREFDGRGLIFAPGCVVPQDVNPETLKTVVKTVDTLIPI